MVWIGGPRRGQRGKPLMLHDPPPGYRPPRLRLSAKERQRLARRDWILEHVLAVVLVLSAAAVLVIILLIIVTHH